MKGSDGKAGFTLIEIMIAMAIAAAVLLGVYSVFSGQVRAKSIHEQVVGVQQNIRSAMFQLDNDLRMAGYRGDLTNITTGFVAGTGPTSVAFTMLAAEDDEIDNDGDGETDEFGELATVMYALYDGDADGVADDLGRTMDGATLMVADNIEAIEFFYTTIDNTGAQAQSTAPAALDTIRSVTVSVLARSRREVPGGSTGGQFTAASGAVWGPFNDNFFRRFETSTIECRNM
ncbi:hypothetical protein JCM14469_27550 [Desulfatiferula olefinivorans]